MPAMRETPKRRRYQFSLRSLMIVVTYTAITAGILTWLGPPIVARHYLGRLGELTFFEENWPSIVALTAEAISIIFIIAKAVAQ
jgi:hypothetical protein